MDARTLRALSRDLVRELGMFAPQCCATPLTPVEAHLLIELESADLTNNQLAERLRVDKSNTSRPLSRLQERGLVDRVPHQQDGRSQQLRLTDQGRSLLQQLHQQLDNRTAAMLALFSDDEQQQLRTGIERYLQGLRWLQQQDGYQLRELQAGDQAALAALIRTVSAEHGLTADRGYGVADPQLDALYPLYQGPGRRFWVLLDPQGSLVGGAGIAPLQDANESICELQKMYFLPQARGLGLGRRLLRTALAFAREQGYQHCYLETTAVLARATRLYQLMGFRPLTAPLGNTGHCACEIRMLCDLVNPEPDSTPVLPATGCGCRATAQP